MRRLAVKAGAVGKGQEGNLGRDGRGKRRGETDTVGTGRTAGDGCVPP